MTDLRRKKLNTPCKFPDKTPNDSLPKGTVDINHEDESIETLLNQMEIGRPLPVDDMSQCIRFPTMWHARPAKSQISLHMRAV